MNLLKKSLSVLAVAAMAVSLAGYTFLFFFAKNVLVYAKKQYPHHMDIVFYFKACLSFHHQ